MSGSSTPPRALPRARELIIRLALVTVALLGLVYVGREQAVQGLVPIFRLANGLVDEDFSISSVEVVRANGLEQLRFQANLAHPLRLGGQTLRPFGWQGMPLGGYRVNLDLDGVLAFSAVTLILVLAWPAAGMRELLPRTAVGLLLAVLLAVVDMTSTVIAELRNGVQQSLGVSAPGAWVVWSRFLMGGGGLCVGILLGAVAIGIGRVGALAHGPRPGVGDTKASSAAAKVAPDLSGGAATRVHKTYNVNHYHHDSYDGYFCLKPSLLLWATILFLARAIALPLVAVVLSVSGGTADVRTLVTGMVDVSTVVSSSIAFIVLYALMRRAPAASRPIRWVWRHGRALLIGSAILDLAHHCYAALQPSAFGAEQAGPALVILSALDLAFLGYLLAAQRVRDVFSDFPASS